MSPLIALEQHEWTQFSVPHSLCLVGELQHLLGAGSLSLATNLRLEARVEAGSGAFRLRFGGGERDETGHLPAAGEEAARLAVLWERGLGKALGIGPEALDGLRVELDLGRLWELCPPQVLAASPAAGVALTVAVLAHRGEGTEASEVELADAACRARRAALSGGEGLSGLGYADALMSVGGGAGYGAPGAERLNVQTLVPPDSLLLVLRPEAADGHTGREREAAVLGALKKILQDGADLSERGDAAFEALFERGERLLDSEALTMLYGLMRVRQMAEEYLECLGDAVVDNDRLAEICDEESAILADYFGFPAEPYDEIRSSAAEAGALGAKLTWAFGGYPAAVVIAPGRRGEVGEALARAFPQVRSLLVDVEPTGLLRGADEGIALPSDP